MSSSFLFRIRFLSVLIIVFALLIIGKLFLVQVIHSEAYKAEADNQYSTPSANIFQRGNMYFSAKDGTLISAATLMSGYKLAINPELVSASDATKTWQALNAIVPMDRANFITRASKKNDPYEEIVNHISKDDADKISALKLSGVSLFQEKWRFYPGDNLASSTLGIIGYKDDTLAGRYGLERQYNSVLSKDPSSLDVNFFAEVFAGIQKRVSGGAKHGDLVLTIEPTVESYLQNEVISLQKQWQAESVGGIIMDPNTGEIIAMAESPDFNLNDFSKVSDTRIFANMNVENVFELGSIMKPLTMAAGLDAGVVKPTTVYNDAGSLTIDGKTIYNFDKMGRGKVDMQIVLNQSLNTGAAYVADKLGHDKMRSYFLNFGLGEKTGIDLPNETSGLVSNLNSPRDLEYATASFGQGIAVTPVEAIRAFASLGNGGVLVTPHLVKEIRYDTGASSVQKFPVGKQVIRPETSKTITSMLIKVIDEGYSKGAYKLEHYTVAAKTGTAQVARDDGKGYYTDKHLHSFFGYFPATNPRFVGLFYIRDPRGALYSSQTLLKPFMSTARFLLNYYDVPPDR